MHAIAPPGSDKVTFGKGCIYCQLAFSGEVNTEASGLDANGDPIQDCEEDDPFLEMRIIPNQDADLSTIFQTLSICAALHPDVVEQEPEEHGSGWIYTQEGIQELSEIGQAAYQHLESVFDVEYGQEFQFRPPEDPEGRFEDAE